MAKQNMKGAKYSHITDLYHSLAAFYSMSYNPRNVADLEGKDGWIISQDEKDAIVKVLDTLEDCGADVTFDQ